MGGMGVMGVMGGWGEGGMGGWGDGGMVGGGGGVICIKLFSTLSINFNSQYQCCGSILSLVQILFSLFQTHYH